MIASSQRVQCSFIACLSQDSLTGDLDMDYQRRLLADYGGTSDLPPGWANVPSPPPLPMLRGAAAPFRGKGAGVDILIVS